MAEFLDDPNRKLVPRWRSLNLTTALGELSGPIGVPRKSFGVDDFGEKLASFRANPKMSSAAELLTAGFAHSRLGDVNEAAEFILRYDEGRLTVLRELARKVTMPYQAADPDDVQSPGEQIRDQRAILSVQPNNPLKWVELARNYLLVGSQRKARRAIEVALQLAPDDRFVLRSATRLYLHLRDPERAYHILHSSDAVPNDPSLIGPEIAVSGLIHKSSGLIRRARGLLEGQQHSESKLSELAAVIATEELQHGSGRKVRQLFQRSLANPNENVVAQVRWAAKKTDAISFDPLYLQVERSFEARAWTEFFKGDWAAALVQSKGWLSDQGFSKRPAGLGSFVAAVAMEDHVEAINILRRGLISNPHDPLLLNNLAYSLACIGNTTESEKYLHAMTIPANDEASASLSIIKTATEGLIEYRKGNRNAGLALYRKAFEAASSAGEGGLRNRVVMFLALEELRAGAAFSDPIIQVAFEGGHKASDPLLQLLANRLLDLRGK